MQTKRKTIVVGISGPPFSGKTRISQQILTRFKCATLLDLNDYRISNGYQPMDYNCQKLESELMTLLNDAQTRLVIIKGTILFTFPQILNFLTVKVYIECPGDDLLSNIVKTDPRGNVDDVLEEYLNEIKPLVENIIEPSRIHSNLSIRPDNKLAIDMICAWIKYGLN